MNTNHAKSIANNLAKCKPGVYVSIKENVTIHSRTSNNIELKLTLYANKQFATTSGIIKEYIHTIFDSLLDMDKELCNVIGYKPVFKQNK